MDHDFLGTELVIGRRVNVSLWASLMDENPRFSSIKDAVPRLVDVFDLPSAGSTPKGFLACQSLFQQSALAAYPVFGLGNL
jgi:hypothetical protein